MLDHRSKQRQQAHPSRGSSRIDDKAARGQAGSDGEQEPEVEVEERDPDEQITQRTPRLGGRSDPSW